MAYTIMVYPKKLSQEAIRTAAVALLKDDGPEALSLRRVASSLGVVPNALYRHLPNRDALVAAVADEAARELLALMKQATDRESEPDQRIRALARAYSSYADAQPAMQTMIVAFTEDGEAALPRPLGKDLLWSFVVDEITGLTGPEAAPSAAVAIWALLQGMMGLRRARLMGGRRPEDVGEFPLETLLAGLRARTPTAASG